MDVIMPLLNKYAKGTDEKHRYWREGFRFRYLSLDKKLNRFAS